MTGPRYQIIRKPRYTASGERGTWSFVAHGATYSRAEALETKERIETLSHDTVRLLRI